MCNLNSYLFYWILAIYLFSFSSTTDLAAVYKNDIFLLRDVDKLEPDTVMDWESLILSVPKPFSYPIGVTYDPDGRRLFVADAMQEDTKIFSLTLDDNYDVIDMQPVVKTTNTTVMEDLTYDHRTRQLYWTDSYNHGVYKTVLPDEQKGNFAPTPELAHVFGNVIEPRGIAIDYCREKMYWTERDGTGNVPSTIEMCDLNESSHTVVRVGDREEDEVEIYYQGLTFDVQNGKLLWAETIGDMFDKSYCRIVSYEFGQTVPEQEVLVSLENCYPFSLTTDDKYIYWADWGQNGIMRASRNNPDHIVKLVHAPQTDTKYGGHHGVYGLAILDGPTDDAIQEACKGKSVSKPVDVKKTKPMPVETTDHTKEKPNPSEKHHHPINESATGESSDHVGFLYIPQKKSSKFPTHDQKGSDDVPVKSQNKKDQQFVKDDQKGADDALIQSQIKQDEQYVKVEPSLIEQPLLYTTDYVHTQNLFGSHVCIENQLLLVVCILALFCILFMSSTAYLLYKLYRQKGLELSIEAAPKVVLQKAPIHRSHQPKRFSRKVKSSGSGHLSCPISPGSDGVSIDIEECCQMTLCETPCYTTVKKEGKGYKTSSPSGRKYSDDTGLLEDTDDISHC
ncbi:hypothetical protein SK128_012345 [Halocaridina rubra]|uniref:Uncharacterized protein n=1 Tax=Halocaridina rubra TaxID=373956 RepID=A0AAN8WXV0_HALRR